MVRGFEGSRPPPIAIAFVRLDGVDSVKSVLALLHEIITVEAIRIRKQTPNKITFCGNRFERIGFFIVSKIDYTD